MAEHHTEPWYPTAAYLYTLHLDGPALAWEYLRRNPDYRLDWLRRRRRSDTAHRWGLRLLEDPELDARDVHPAWFPGHDGVLQLYPDADPPMDATVFSFWSLPGSKCLIDDGKRLMLVLRWPGYSLRLAIAPGLADGMAFAYAISACAQLPGLTAMLQKLATAADASPAATASVRPSLSALQELHTLQALDATLAGVSLHEIAKGLFGEDAAADWYSDGGLRSKVRRLLQRGEMRIPLMADSDSIPIADSVPDDGGHAARVS